MPTQVSRSSGPPRKNGAAGPPAGNNRVALFGALAVLAVLAAAVVLWRVAAGSGTDQNAVRSEVTAAERAAPPSNGVNYQPVGAAPTQAMLPGGKGRH